MIACPVMYLLYIGISKNSMVIRQFNCRSGFCPGVELSDNFGIIFRDAHILFQINRFEIFSKKVVI